MGIKKIISCSVIFFLITLAFLIFYRIHFSVGYWDEPFYISMTYHFLQGAKPFVDELSITQTSSLLLYPIYSLFYLIHPSTSGIVLFSRYLYVFFTLGIFLTLYSFYRQIIDKRMAILIAFIPVVFTPFLIYSLSYNTLSSFFLMTGIIILFYGITHRGFSFISGLCVGAACFCYFPLTAVAIFLLLLMWIYQCTWKFISYYFLGLAIFGGILLYFLLSAGLSNMALLYAFFKSIGTQAGGLHKFELVNMFINFYNAFPHKKLFVAVYLLAIVFHRQFKMSYFIASLIMIFVLAHQGWVENNFMIQLCLIGFIAPLLYFFARKHPLANPILVLIWLPGFVGACVSGLVSGNGWYNAIIGGLAMPMATFLYVFLLGEQLKFNRGNYASIFFMALILVALIKPDLFAYNYGDLPDSALNDKITSGPFSGLYTTPAKKQFLVQLQNDLLLASKHNKSVLFFDDFPAGYLLTSMKPQTNTVWLFSSLRYPTFNKNMTMSYFQNSTQYPDVIIKVLGVAENPNKVVYPFRYPNDSFLKLIQDHYHEITQQENYVIYSKSNV